MQRRTLLGIGAGIVGIGGLTYWQRNNLVRSALTGRSNDGLQLTAQNLDSNMCLLTPEQAEGPFFINAPVRHDIREDRTGARLNLNIKVVRADGCAPVPGAIAEIWHCDAAGRYSAYPENLSRSPFETMMFLGDVDGHVEPTNEKRYLRGAQAADAAGDISFTTIVPGWYEPRVPHIHVKVFVDGRSYLTTQLYFPDSLTEPLYTEHPDYAPYGRSPYTHANDTVLGAYLDAQSLLLQPAPKQDADGPGYRADCLLAIA